ncbi:MAG: hypothetical protein ACRCV0_01455 [Brevinema sp.]
MNIISIFISIFLLLFNNSTLFSQDLDTLYQDEYFSTMTETPYSSYYPDQVIESNITPSNLYLDKQITDTNQGTINLLGTITNINIPAYKTYNRNKLLKSLNFPELVTSKNLLENLNNTFWQLKYFDSWDTKFYTTVQLSFSNLAMNTSVINNHLEIVDQKQYRLLPVKMITPNEGIFIHGLPDGTQIFIYIKLFLPHMLVVKIVNTFEDAERIANVSITKLPIFIIL